MSGTTARKPDRRPPRDTRRTFTVAEQLRGKLGRRAADDLIGALKRAARPGRRS